MWAGSRLLPGVATGRNTIRLSVSAALCPLPRPTAESHGDGAAWEEENATLGASRRPAPRELGSWGAAGALSAGGAGAGHCSQVGGRGCALCRAAPRRAIAAPQEPEGLGTKGCSGTAGTVEASGPLRAGARLLARGRSGDDLAASSIQGEKRRRGRTSDSGCTYMQDIVTFLG